MFVADIPLYDSELCLAKDNDNAEAEATSNNLVCNLSQKRREITLF